MDCTDQVKKTYGKAYLFSKAYFLVALYVNFQHYKMWSNGHLIEPFFLLLFVVDLCSVLNTRPATQPTTSATKKSTSTTKAGGSYDVRITIALVWEINNI